MKVVFFDFKELKHINFYILYRFNPNYQKIKMDNFEEKQSKYGKIYKVAGPRT